MVAIVLDRTFVSLVATGATVQAYTGRGRARAYKTQGSAEAFAGGRYRSITIEGVAGEQTFMLRDVSESDIETLKTWMGQTVLVRDNRGRRMFGTYYEVGYSDRITALYYDVTLNVNEVSYAEGGIVQPRITPLRSTLTAAQIEALIKTDTSIVIGMGMELLDRDLNVLTNLTTDLRECQTSRDNTATLHGSCAFTTTARMSWGRAVVRPYVTISNGTIKAQFNQGAYFTSTPQTITDYVPATFTVQGVDILNALNTLVGDSYALAAGGSYLTAVENILVNLGFSQYIIDPAQQDVTATTAKGWPLDDTTTWLSIVNELLKAVGYSPAYSDWDGRIICSAFTYPGARSPEWTYDRGQYTGQLVPGQEITHDYFATPNRWVGVSDTGGVIPIEGNGVFTYVNQSSGETSIDARQQVITRVIQGLTVAGQSSLVAAIMAEVAKDKNVGTVITAKSSANPLHWHQDIVKVETLELGVLTMQQTKWSMDLRTGQMSHDWAAI